MIDAKELRIGNYVFDNGDGNLYKIPSGFSISANMEMNPIPITEEWLLKFGFENENHWYSIVVSGLTFLLVHKKLSESKRESFDCSLKAKDSGVWFSGKIQHVHQLQNLYFALTGEDLTLNQQL
jgi:hypothetical protein